MKKLLTLFLLTLFSSTFTIAQNQNEPLVNDMRDRLKSESFNVGLLLQSTANFSFDDDNFLGGRGFGIGVSRLKFNGLVDQSFSYNFQLEFSRNRSLIDLALGYHHSEHFVLKAGIMKPDIGLDLQPNPGDTDFINRSRIIGAMLNSREIGISASGQFEAIDYNIAIFNGYGIRTFDNDNRFMYLAKLGYAANLEDGASLYVGGNMAFNSSTNELVGNTGQFSDEDRFTYGMFARYDSDIWFGAAEFLQSSYDAVLSERITGFYTTIGNKLDEKNEVLVRWDHLSFDEMDRIDNLIIFGWNHQATSVISFQVNLLGLITKNNGDRFGLQGNFQFQF
jgi:hypothetical protein